MLLPAVASMAAALAHAVSSARPHSGSMRASALYASRPVPARAHVTASSPQGVRAEGGEADNSFTLGNEHAEDDEAVGRLFAVFGRDHESLDDVRFSTHDAHTQYLREVTGVCEAGYFLHDHLRSAAGTMYVIDAHNPEQAMAVAANDPFNEAGLFEELYVNEWVRLLEPGLDNRMTSPPFLLYCRDREDAGSLRADTRPKHLEWLRSSAERIVMVGPLSDPDPLAVAEQRDKCGTMLIVCGDSLEEVRAWAATDPYAKAGLFETVVCAPYTSLDVADMALPNAPGPPLEEWWSDEERAAAPPLFVTAEELDNGAIAFTEDGALRSPEQEAADTLNEERSEAFERWAEAIERQRLGALLCLHTRALCTDAGTDASPIVSFEGVDGDPELEGLFWRETDEDLEADWPFIGEPEDEEALREASARVPVAPEDEEGADLDAAAAAAGLGEDGLVVDGSQQDNSLQQM